MIGTKKFVEGQGMADKPRVRHRATIEGVVRAPSAFSITRAWLPSMMATQEFVVPRSIPMTLPMFRSLSDSRR